MIVLFAALALTTNSALPVAPKPAASPGAFRSQAYTVCPNYLTQAASDTPASFYRLGDLPDANMEIAVARVSGCQPAPLIVRYRVSR